VALDARPGAPTSAMGPAGDATASGSANHDASAALREARARRSCPEAVAQRRQRDERARKNVRFGHALRVYTEHRFRSANPPQPVEPPTFAMDVAALGAEIAWLPQGQQELLVWNTVKLWPECRQLALGAVLDGRCR
jgi:hypothetical protein